MNNALLNKRLHGLNRVGQGTATEGSAPGKRTLTESLEFAPSASGHDATATAPVQHKAYGSTALSAFSVSAAARSFASSGADIPAGPAPATPWAGPRHGLVSSPRHRGSRSRHADRRRESP